MGRSERPSFGFSYYIDRRVSCYDWALTGFWFSPNNQNTMGKGVAATVRIGEKRVNSKGKGGLLNLSRRRSHGGRKVGILAQHKYDISLLQTSETV